MNIGQAAAASGVTAKMIRHYEESGLIPAPRRTSSNYRSYSENDVHVLRFVKRARALGFSMADIKTLLSLWRDKSRPSSTVKRVARTHIDELQRKIAELQSMVGTLQHLVHHCHGDHRPQCPIIEELAK
jgi:MerR family gold-responsive transcriptional activator of gol and ges genes